VRRGNREPCAKAHNAPTSIINFSTGDVKRNSSINGTGRSFLSSSVVPAPPFMSAFISDSRSLPKNPCGAASVEELKFPSETIGSVTLSLIAYSAARALSTSSQPVFLLASGGGDRDDEAESFTYSYHFERKWLCRDMYTWPVMDASVISKDAAIHDKTGV
jgi:hypothetical protein